MKRFTEIAKWDDPWFRALKPLEKLLFLFVIENCNNGGFYEVDQGAIAFKTGLTPAEIDEALLGLTRGIFGASGWLWVRRFLKHQKNADLNPQNGAHRQIIALLSEQVKRFSGCPEFCEFIAPYKGLLSPIGIGTGIGTGKKGKGTVLNTVAEEIYAAYPLKKGKPKAITAIRKACQKYGASVVLQKTQDYSQVRNGDLRYVPNPATWFNEERFNDDPSTWVSTDAEVFKDAKSAFATEHLREVVTI